MTGSSDINSASTPSDFCSENMTPSITSLITSDEQSNLRLKSADSSQGSFSPVPSANENAFLSLQEGVREAPKPKSTEAEDTRSSNCKKRSKSHIATSIHHASSNKSHDVSNGNIEKRSDPYIAAVQSYPQSNMMSSLSAFETIPAHQSAVPNLMDFAGSSSGLTGLPLDNSWQRAGNLWTAQEFCMTDQAVTDSTDSGLVFPSYSANTHMSFGSDLTGTDGSTTSGFQPTSPNEPLRTYPGESQRVLGAQCKQQHRKNLPQTSETLYMKTEFQGSSSFYHYELGDDSTSRLPLPGQSFDHSQWQ